MTVVGDGPLKADLEKEIYRLGLYDKIELLGAKSEEEVGKLFMESDIMLFTGLVASNGDRDGIPNVIPEAMSAGSLILASCYASSKPLLMSICFLESQGTLYLQNLLTFAQNPLKYEKIRKKT